MVRTTDATRRTKRDLEYLADAATDLVPHTTVDPDKADDPDRNARLRSHGWLASQGSYTADGQKIAIVVDELRVAREFDWVVDIFGAGDFADLVTDARTADDAVDTFRRVLSAANLCDDARHRAGTQDKEPAHDGLFAPHIDAVDTSTGSVDLTFESADTAAEFVDLHNTDFGSTAAVRHADDPSTVTVAPA